MSIRARDRFDVLRRDRFCCAYCGRGMPEVALEIDHVFPRSKGGTDEYQNLVAACQDCNAGKSNHPLSEDPPTTRREQEVDDLALTWLFDIQGGEWVGKPEPTREQWQYWLSQCTASHLMWLLRSAKEFRPDCGAALAFLVKEADRDTVRYRELREDTIY